MPKTKDAPRKTLPAGIGKVLKRLHYPLDVIVLCVRWYVAYSLSLRNLEEMMAERGIEVDHSSVHRWVIKLAAVVRKGFSTAQATGWQELEDGRNLRQGQRPMEVPVPRRRQAGQHG